MSTETNGPAHVPVQQNSTLSSTRSLSHWRTLLSYQGIILGAVCALVSMIIIVVEVNTKQSIAERQLEDRLNNLSQVLPKELYDNNPSKDVLEINDKAISDSPVEIYPARRKGLLTAVAYQVTTVGYGGPMTLMMGVDRQGQILGVRVITHKETPGLSTPMEADKSNWIFGFNGKSLKNTSDKDWLVKKDGGNVDQFSGATITPRAIVKGVHQGLAFFQRHQAELNKTTGTAVGAQ
jgi:electron transport complex protein RnfG